MTGHRCSGRRPVQVVGLLAALVVAAFVVLGGGCAKREDIHPALRLEDADLERAKRQGCSLISLGADPYEAYARDFQDVNKRLSAHVILRAAACCWPADEVAFHIAQSGDASDAAVDQAANEAVELTKRVLRFAAVLQMPKDKDPASLQWALRTSAGTEYPALEVEEPYYIRDAKSYYDENAPASGLYYYMVKFPVRGGGGIPPIGPGISALYLVVREGTMEAQAEFFMPLPRAKR